ncbi:hypothetical protein ONR57_20720 [Hoyosella sp. YIM 151337]|uniref:hypothetical protein n=1 Tax=Hoyosella sp. YIM 151337 TaxID=2992742 RepID=UPI0022356EEB|nr:hypothetical protein [Hoyosella sp. YIM 151337]MCW4355733.1 hypothetical protein [Hoyosella sp. YIM 151337]
MGISLTAEDVADSILRIAESRSSLIPRGPHYPVGWQSTAFMAVADLVPWWILRQINRVTSGH